jgi:hypothetical protein
MNLRKLVHDDHAVMHALLIELDSHAPGPSLAREVRLLKLDRFLARYWAAVERVLDPAMNAVGQAQATARLQRSHARVRSLLGQLRAAAPDAAPDAPHEELQGAIAELLKLEQHWLESAIKALPRKTADGIAAQWKQAVLGAPGSVDAPLGVAAARAGRDRPDPGWAARS